MDWDRCWWKKALLGFGEVYALCALYLLAGCSSTSQVLEPGLFYKRDLSIEVNGQSHEGVVVVPRASQYEIVISPRGDADLLRIQSCHREESFEKISGGWFKKNQFKYSYSPRPGLEDEGVCPLRIDVYEAKPGRHSWALIEMEHPDYTVSARLHCNGSTSVFNGVGVCQGKSDTIQKLEFMQEVRFAPPMPSSCSEPKKVDGLSWEFQMSYGECLFHFQTRDGRVGRLTTVGYTGLLVREAQ